MTAPLNTKREPPYKLLGLVVSLLTVAILVLVYMLFRGDFLDREKLTMISSRSGLSMDPGAKVTYNGVEIGRVGEVQAVDIDGEPHAKLILDVNKKWIHLIPKNVDADITATTVFG
ncbi:MAG: MlaD family protein, partial [Mycolicibacterium hassiacum]